MLCLNNICPNYLLPAACMLLFSTGISQIPKYNSNTAATPTVYLDFDGHTVEGTPWNWESTIYAKPSGLSKEIITEVYNRVAEDYRIFNINITTDSTVYAKAPVAKRMRVIVTPTHEWYGSAAGVAYVNSFNWADGTPAWVFNKLLSNNPKFIGEAASHEIGHTLGLQHQSTYDNNCGLVTEYAEGRGEGEIGWAPIMGVGYYKNLTTWTVGPNILSCDSIQNDIEVICNGEQKIGLLTDDYDNSILKASRVNVQANNFQSHGMITNETDKDVFKVVVNTTSVLKAKAVPGSTGNGNSGANIDIKLSLLDSKGDTLTRANPANLLSASIDTNLKAGTYYLAIDGVANQNLDDYGSIGYYVLGGSLDAVLPVTRLVLKGTEINNDHIFNWEFESDEPVKEAIVESSEDGINYRDIATLSPAITKYSYKPWGNGSIYYRIKMITTLDDKAYYSNIINLKCAGRSALELRSNIIYNTAQLSSNGNYTYQVTDETGRLYQQGRITAGVNNIMVNTARKGLLLMKVYNATHQEVFKLLKH